MTQQVDLRYNPDVMPLAFVHNLLHVCLRQRNAVAQLRMTFKLVVVVDAKEQRVYLARCKFIANELHKRFQRLLARRSDAEPANGEQFIEFVLCARQKGAERQHERERIPGKSHGGLISSNLANWPFRDTENFGERSHIKIHTGGLVNASRE